MNSIARWSVATLALCGAAFHPQVSASEEFDGSKFLKWSKASQTAYLQNSIVMAMTVSSRMSEAHSTCISEWFFDADGFRDGREEGLRQSISQYSDYHPGGIIVAVIERECGEFGQN